VIACSSGWLKNRQAIYRGDPTSKPLGPRLDFVCWKMRREYNQTSYGYDGRTNSADVIGRPG
jgi:hypothetical protein